jgi:hypothetical protein
LYFKGAPPTGELVELKRTIGAAIKIFGWADGKKGGQMGDTYERIMTSEAAPWLVFI